MGGMISPLYIELSKYGTQIARFYDVFPPEQILVLTMAQINKNPIETMKKVSTALGMSTTFWQNYSFPRKNSGSVPRNLFAKKILYSSTARWVGRMLIHHKLRPYVGRNILGRSSSKKEIAIKDREVIWSICESEIHLAESIIGQHFPELWETYPGKTNE